MINSFQAKRHSFFGKNHVLFGNRQEAIMANPKFAQLGHQVIYRFVGGTPENGILSCGFMRKPTAQKSQINFKIPYYSCFVLLSGSGEYQDETGFAPRFLQDALSSAFPEEPTPLR